MLRDLYISLELGFPSTCFLWRIRVPKEKKKRKKKRIKQREANLFSIFFGWFRGSRCGHRGAASPHQRGAPTRSRCSRAAAPTHPGLPHVCRQSFPRKRGGFRLALGIVALCAVG